MSYIPPDNDNVDFSPVQSNYVPPDNDNVDFAPVGSGQTYSVRVTSSVGTISGSTTTDQTALRTVTSTVSTVNASATKALTATRQTTSTVSPIVGNTTTAVSVVSARQVTSSVGTVNANLTKTATFNRTPTSSVGPVVATAIRAETFVRSVNSNTSPLVGNTTTAIVELIEKNVGSYVSPVGGVVKTTVTSKYTKAVTASLSPLDASLDRTTSLDRTGTAAVAPIGGSTATNVSLSPMTVTSGISTIASKATLFDPSTFWRVEDVVLKSLKEETRKPREIEMEFQPNETKTQKLQDRVNNSPEQYEVVERFDGTFQTIDRSNGNGLVEISPPEQRRPLREKTTTHVEEYDEEVLGQTADEYKVSMTLTFRGEKPPSPGGTFDTTQGTGEWLFDMAEGSVSTDRIQREIDRGRSEVEGTVEVTLVLTLDEADIVERSLNQVAATRVREVPDAPNIAEDRTETDRNTVTVSVPSERDPDEEILKNGDYVAQEYETRLVNDEICEVELELSPAG